MMILPLAASAASTAASSIMAHSVLLLTLMTENPTTLLLSQNPSSQQSIPVIEIVKVYGKLADSTCYGLQAPSGSSCQIELNQFKQNFGLLGEEKLTKQAFTDKLNSLQFQWPLKPYGIEKSLTKTAIMNKGAETRVYMEELESRNLYDKRNPTGPLPTSLRPKLNQQIQNEGIDTQTIDFIWNALITNGKTSSNELTAKQIEEIFHGQNEIDYYDFLKIIGTESIMWPN